MAPRDDSSSRSRSNKRKKYRKYSSDSDRSRSRRKSVKEDKKLPALLDLQARSDIKNHVIFDEVKIQRKGDDAETMEHVRKVLKSKFGPIQHVTRLAGDDFFFSFAVGFKYDEDAYNFVKSKASLQSHDDRGKLVPKVTPTFEYCMPLIKEAFKSKKVGEEQRYEFKPRQKSPSRKNYKRSYSQQKRKKHHRSSSSSQSYHKRRSYDRKQRHSHGRSYQKTIWLFGLPWTIKGKQIQRQLGQHRLGHFPVNSWKWIRIKDSNCEFMSITMDEKKANKLLSIRDDLLIEGFPVIVTLGCSSQSQETVKDCLQHYQVRITFPERVNPALVYKAMNDSVRVVQLVSCRRLVDGRSDNYIVTLCNAAKVREIKRMGYLPNDKINVEDIKGQLVYRPNKNSQLRENA